MVTEKATARGPQELRQLQRENSALREQAVDILLEMFMLRERADARINR
jgi:hypothetical protein